MLHICAFFYVCVEDMEAFEHQDVAALHSPVTFLLSSVFASRMLTCPSKTTGSATSRLTNYSDAQFHKQV